MPESLNCPNCGAGTTADAVTCAYCGSRLATVACPSCLGSIFVGSEYCGRCGAKIVAAASVDDATLPCPGCKGTMRHVSVGQTNMHQCDACGSAWLTPDDFKALCTNRQALGAIVASLGAAAPKPATVAATQRVRYVPCAVCHTPMNRVNFGQKSGVIVDLCKDDGIWFERDELRQVLDFVANGGLERPGKPNEDRDDARARALSLDPLLFHEGASANAQMAPVVIRIIEHKSIASSILDALFH